MKINKVILILILMTISFISCKDKESNNPPTQPIPDKGEISTCEVLRPTLSWNCSDADIDQLSYTLMFGTSPTSLSIKASELYSNNYTFSEALQPSTTYYWQIIATDKKDKTISDIWEFSTIGNPVDSKVPSTPILHSPNFNTKAGNVLFTWRKSADDGTVSYILTINNSIVGNNLTDTTYMSEILTDFEWFITVKDNDGNRSESEHLQIKVQ